EITKHLFPRWPTVTSRAAACLVVVVALIVVLGSQQRDLIERQASLYSIDDRASTVRMADWINANVPQGASVAVLTARTGKWIEGLTGHDALFTNEVRFSFRPEEWDRSVAADALLRSTTALTNGLLDVKFI